MKQFIKDIWYGEPVRVFGALGAAGTAVVGFVEMPNWAKAIIVAVEAIAAFYGTRRLTTPEHLEKLSPSKGGGGPDT